MRLKNWNNLFFCILLVSSAGSWRCIRVDAAESANTDIWHSKNLASTQVNYQPCQNWKQEVINSLCKQSSEPHPSNSQMPLNKRQGSREQKAGEIVSIGIRPYLLRQLPVGYDNQLREVGDSDSCSLVPCPLAPASLLKLAQQRPETTQPPDTTKEPEDTQKQNDPPQLESQPGNLPTSPPDSKEELLNAPEINQSQRLERLMQLLQLSKQPPESDSDRELGLRVRLRPLEQPTFPPIEQPVIKFKPIGYLQGHIAYFQTSNIFSSKDIPIEDGLIFSGLTLASAYFPLGAKTFLNGSIDGNLIRYINQSQYDYNQLRFNLGIYQQLSQRMYGEVSWSNQQLFYANNSDRLDSFKAGDRFLNENSFQVSLGRRDPLTSKLVLNSFYELSVNFADPQSRDRIINSFWVSLNYYLQNPLQVGIDYQVNFSDFTQRDREDQFHRLFGHLNYRISDTSNMSVQAGVSLGSSTAENIDFDGWFFTINYSLQLGQF
ncbi:MULTISPECIES: hypothetical protein [unclassified Nostoc]|uniref:hypothetical protein n=1 Tax=unclassified Nostoc TaxID=2593658 RepID=UPI002AD4C511|nr:MULTISPECIES: hypothetical protein [unclassified Nostoc]MDZ8126364.1 hypothetical protein [Nostoc sp. CmiVER01]MDZ8222984.1 hypothetical protein [Nostoc sp. ChiVER01]